MFVQSDTFAHRNKDLFYCGQEAKDFTYRLCRMNLFLHGLEGDIRLGSSYDNDQFAAAKKFDYILANPPFNDGAKGDDGWGAHRIADKDPRLSIGPEKLPLSPRNANTLWMLHFVHHLSDAGTAGFVMATGELSNSEISRLAVRKALVEHGYVDCIVTLTGQLFANTQIPCSLWFLSKTRDGRSGPDGVLQRPRRDRILFIDGRKLGSLIPGSRKQKQLSDSEIERIATAYSQFRFDGKVDAVPGFCNTASISDVRDHGYALTPSRYVGAEEGVDDDEPFEEKFPKLTARLEELFQKGAKLAEEIRGNLQTVEAGEA
jgi:type I restriction enzyme M protein